MPFFVTPGVLFQKKMTIFYEKMKIFSEKACNLSKSVLIYPRQPQEKRT